jgi:hypothetical protein
MVPCAIYILRFNAELEVDTVPNSRARGKSFFEELSTATALGGPPSLRARPAVLCLQCSRRSPSLEHLSPLAQLTSLSFASLSPYIHSLAWIGDLVSMASTCCQPIAPRSACGSIFESGLQFSKPPTSSDTSLLGSAARFHLSMVDVSASMDDRRCQAPPALSHVLPSARTADLPENGEIFDSDDDDLPSLRQISVSSRLNHC